MTKLQWAYVLIGAVLLGCTALAAWGLQVGDWWAVLFGAAPVAGFLGAAVWEAAQKVSKG